MRNFIVFAGIVCLVGGCAGGGGGSTVTGKVALDDGSAAPRGSVTLRNDAGSFRGTIQSDGTYTVENVADGEYQVAVAGVNDREMEQAEGLTDVNEETGEYVESGKEPPKSLIDIKYSNPQTSGLTVTVPGGNYDLTVQRAAE
jgi:hypothetical protein